MYKILLVEDELRLQEIVVDYFKAKDCNIVGALNGSEALELLETESFDLILLDVMMPGLDGFKVCQKIRKDSETPIIFVTARSEEEDQLQGYAYGADDYITKPFSLGILYAKSMALIKRSQGTVVDNCLRGSGICIDCKTHEVLVRDRRVELTPMAYKVLVYLMRHRQQIITREQLIIRLWGYDFEGNDRVIDSHIKKLRKALGNKGKCIKTIVKVGYKFEGDQDEL